MARVLVIDADAALRADLARTLTQAGHDVELAAGARAGAALARTSMPDLVVLDPALPDGDGIEVVIALRADPRGRRTPVLVVSAVASEDARVRAFEAGADDFVPKPFSMRELLLRLRAQQRRRSAPPPSDLVVAGPIVVDRAARRVSVAGAAVPLTRRELDLLLVLAERRGRVQSREVLVADVWGGEVEGDSGRVVDSTIKRLRRKLGVAGRLVATVRGTGYRLATPDDDEAATPRSA